MEQPDLIIFDCDGVLVDSEIIAARVDTELLAEAGIEIPVEEFIERFAGLTFTEAVIRIEAEHDVPLQATIIDRSNEILDRRLAREVKEVPGAAMAVASIAVPKCICSNSAPNRLDAMLKRTGMLVLFSGHIYSARTIPSQKTKPAPDVFLYAAEQMKADPARCFVVEDSVHGVTAARAAGMRVIGFTGGSHSFPGHADVLTEAGAETVIRRWAEFPQTLEALTLWSEEAAQ